MPSRKHTDATPAHAGPAPTNALKDADVWRSAHLGRWLAQAQQRFEQRVMQLLAHDPMVPLGLSNLAARQQVGAAQLHITQHLSAQGSRLSDLAQAAGMSKQAMADLVVQCEAWGMVTRHSDALDKRAKRIHFTAIGLAWLQGYHRAVQQAQAEFAQAVGEEVATVVALGLEVYGGEPDSMQRQREGRINF
jgi:DNA-binding MarR family transcriptional regulator